MGWRVAPLVQSAFVLTGGVPLCLVRQTTHGAGDLLEHAHMRDKWDQACGSSFQLPNHQSLGYSRRVVQAGIAAHHESPAVIAPETYLENRLEKHHE